MTKGHVFLAQNSTIDYVKQACLLASSIKKFNKENKTCIITNDPIPPEYSYLFDHIVNIPWTDLANKSEWKIENRWKIIHATPFKENIVYDVDMLLLDSNDHWWNYFKNYDLFFTTTVRDYRNNIITKNFYRKTFTLNKLVNVYTGCFYFKKTKTSFEFFKWLEIITNNWKEIYKNFLPNGSKQNFVSMDLNAALALRFMNIEEKYISNKNLIPSFVHMKPMIQDWINFPTNCVDVLDIYVNNNCELFVNNIKQHGLFHYVENEFLKEDMFYKFLK